MPPRGYKMSEESKKEISLKLKQYFKDNPHPKHTEESKKLISIKNKGKKRTPEQRKHLSLVCKERLKNPENHPAWKGGRAKHGDYIKVKFYDHLRANKYGYVLEHIIVWEQFNGKPVPRGHAIHHLNGIKNDNRPENLVAIAHAEHIHRGVPYQKRIIELEEENMKLKMMLQWPEKIQEFPIISKEDNPNA